MPVSNPSEFPPHRAGDQIIGIESGQNYVGSNVFFAGESAGANARATDMVLIGHLTGSAGILDHDLDGTTAIGSQTLVSLTAGVGNSFPIIAVGPHIAPALVAGDSCVLIGSDILTVYADTGGTAQLSQSVFIGHDLMPGATGLSGATTGVVMIGFGILKNAAGIIDAQSSVFIGDNLMTGADPNAGVSNTVLIGHNAGNAITGGSSNANVTIGANASANRGGAGNVIIGFNAAQTGAGGTVDFSNVVVGTAASSTGSLNTVLGAGATTALLANNIGGVSIGANAGVTLDPAENNVLVIESSTATGGGSGNAASALIFGSFLSGNLVLGNSLPGVNRDKPTALQLTNAVKLLDNTVAVPSFPVPVGGGYFYVTGGALHWIGSGGTDTAIAPA